MRNDGLARVRFFDRQFLRPRDLVAEQLYHQIAHQRHNIGPHSWGIVAGLGLSLVEGDLYVEPGMAIDGYGRDLVLADRRPIRAEEFDQRGVELLHVWLAYAEEAGDGAPDGYGGCIDPTRANGAGNGVERSNYRWREAPILLLTDGRVSAAPRALPEGVPSADVPFAPQRAFPIEAEQWSVYLGTVERNRTGATTPFEIITAGRPYVDLVGWRINHPSGVGHIDLGSETDPRRRFAVHIEENGTTTDPRLAIDQVDTTVNGQTVTTTTLSVRSNTVVQGDVTVEAGTVGFLGKPPHPPGSPPKYDNQPRPAQLYRCGAADATTPSLTNDELRIEMGASQTAGQGRNRVVIGKFNAETKQFEPCLTITDECLVQVHGNLVVEGTLPDKPVTGRAQQSRALANLLLPLKLSIASGTSADLTTLFAAALARQPPARSRRRTRPGAAVSAVEADVDRVRDVADASTTLAEVAAGLVDRDRDLVERLIKVLGDSLGSSPVQDVK